MARKLGVVCYVLGWLLVVAAIVWPVVATILCIIVWAWSSVFANMPDTSTAMSLSAPSIRLPTGKEPIGVLLELVFYLVAKVMKFLGPAPTIVAVILSVIVEIALIVGAVVLLVIGRLLRRRPKTVHIGQPPR